MSGWMAEKSASAILVAVSLAGAAFAACSDFPDVPDTAFVTGGGSPTTTTGPGPAGGGGNGGDPATTTTGTTTTVVTTGPACVGTDADGDGVCVGGPGPEDCDDSNPDVFPGQESFFPTARPGAQVPFDYNCDGQETQQFPQPCAPTGPCPGAVGFTTDVACGNTGEFGDCKTTALVCAVSNTSTRTQACR